MIEFRIRIDKKIDKILQKIRPLVKKKEIDEYGIAKISLLLNEGKEVSINMAPYIDIDRLNICLRIWGFTKEKELIKELEEIFETKIIARIKKPSILEIAGKIINIYNSGIKDRETLLHELSTFFNLTTSETNRYISLIKQMASRKTANEKIKKAYKILFSS